MKNLLRQKYLAFVIICTIFLVSFFIFENFKVGKKICSVYPGFGGEIEQTFFQRCNCQGTIIKDDVDYNKDPDPNFVYDYCNGKITKIYYVIYSKPNGVENQVIPITSFKQAKTICESKYSVSEEFMKKCKNQARSIFLPLSLFQ